MDDATVGMMGGDELGDMDLELEGKGREDFVKGETRGTSEEDKRGEWEWGGEAPAENEDDGDDEVEVECGSLLDSSGGSLASPDAMQNFFQFLSSSKSKSFEASRVGFTPTFPGRSNGESEKDLARESRYLMGAAAAVEGRPKGRGGGEEEEEDEEEPTEVTL